MSKKRTKSKTQKISERIVTGIASAFICSALLLAIFSFAIYKGVLDYEASDWIVIAINIISAMLCGYRVTKSGEGNIIKCGLFPGIIFGFIIWLLSLAIKFEGFSMSEALKILLISAAGSTIGSIIKLCTSNKMYHK